MNAPVKTDALGAAINAHATTVLAPAKALIGASFRDAAGGATMNVISPIDGKVLTTIAACSAQDVDDAVAAARQAFADRRWSGMAPKDRKLRMLRWAELIDSHRAELAVLQSRDMGMPVGLAYNADLAAAVEAIRWYAEAIDKLYGEIAPLPAHETGMISRVPLGVVGAIVPWNFPAMIAAWKLGPALAVGNSVVLKPAEDASLVLLAMARLALEAGLPEGVLNVVSGSGAQAGDALASHNDVDCLTFTGSGGVGRKILEASARSNLKRVSLECGGKSASIIMADAPDLAAAAIASTRAIFMNQGQICNAPSRLLVQRQALDEVLEHVGRTAGALRMGSPLDTTSDLGPIVNAAQLAKIHEGIESAREDGSSIMLDGRDADMPKEGFYCGPTVATGVAPSSQLGQEEVFGPVLAVMTFDTAQEAVSIANGTRYGLGAAVWSRDIDTVHAMTDRLLAGQIIVNGIGGTAIEVPFGGFKQSGFGRDRSLHALDKYTDQKSVIIRSKRDL